MTPVPLTPEQLVSLQPLIDEANKPMSPDVLICQIRRLDWTQGAAVILDCKIIPRPAAEQMRAAYRAAIQQINSPTKKQKKSKVSPQAHRN
jgi:hypothetical protein